MNHSRLKAADLRLQIPGFGLATCFSWRRACLPAAACLFAFVFSGFVHADPPDDVVPWPDAPKEFQWDLLGPRTETVDLSSFAVVYHVSANTGSDATGDGTAARPWGSVRRALEAVDPTGDTGHTAILVAAGKYVEGTLQMKPASALFGGFDPADWRRNIFENPTILSGDRKNRVLIGADDSIIDGFIFEDGLVRDHGAGLYCRRVSPTVTNNIFRRNRTLEPEDFDHDSSRRRQRGHDGGAIGLVDFANPDIRHNLFHDNETEVGYGAAISAKYDCVPIIGHNVFWNNRTGLTDVNDTRSSNGGAIGLLNSSHPAIMHNLFVKNEVMGNSDGGAIFCEYYSRPDIAFNAFLNNYAADDGGAVDSQKLSKPHIRSNLFYGNRVQTSGGAIHMDDSLAVLKDNVFAHNHAGRAGGAFGHTHGWYHATGNTVVFNHAEHGGGAVHTINVKSPFFELDRLEHNIFYHNSDDELFMETGAEVHHNIIRGGHPGFDNRDIEPNFIDDGIALNIGAATQSQAEFSTVLNVNTPLEPNDLKGRILRIGDAWTMIRDNDRNSLRIWGPVTVEPGSTGEILPTYQTR